MSTDDELEGGEDLVARLDAARFAICALLGALERVRDLIAGGYFPEAKAQAEAALLDADAYLRLVEGIDHGDGEPI
jgi:hypothetical protein